MDRKVKFNNETKLFETITVETQDDTIKNKKNREKKLISWLAVIISFLMLLLTCLIVHFSNQQNRITETQANTAKSEYELNVRELDIHKMPHFSISVDLSEMYDEDEYRARYRMWLYKNGIDNFFDWQYSNWVEGKFEYLFDPYEFLSKEVIELYLLSVKDVWRFNRYIHDSDTSKYFNGQLSEKDVPANDSVFWNAYIDNDQEKLSTITNGEFDDLYGQYKEYLSNSSYLSYEHWKSLHRYETQKIELNNTGAFIRNATLEAYVFEKFIIISDDKEYSFGIDMNGLYLSEYYTGNFSSTLINYETKSKTFSIEFTTSPQYTSDQYQGVSAVWDNAAKKLENIVNRGVKVTYIISQPIYFSITYLDVEQQKQRDWYRYDPINYTLFYLWTVTPGIDEPDITQYDFLDPKYFAACSEYTAKCLGYSNSQFKTVDWFDDESYFALAEDKLLTDIDNLFSKQ